MGEPLEILCFTDVLCVFSYVGDARFEQLKVDFRDQVRLTYHFIGVYGDVRRRLETSGKSDAEYGAGVRDVADRFDHVKVHPDVFRKLVPTSSLPAHLYLRAVKLLEDDGVLPPTDGASRFEKMMWDVRLAFFRDLVDVSQRDKLDEIAARNEVPPAEISRMIDNGRAYAELARDTELQRKYAVPVSPSLVLNEGRQLLNGNVGYRVIEANIRELLHKPPDEMSWC